MAVALSVLLLGLPPTCAAAASSDTSTDRHVAASERSDRSDDLDEERDNQLRHHRSHHSRKLWSGSLGITAGRCLHRTGSEVAPASDAEPSTAPQCPTDLDTLGRWQGWPEHSGLALDGSLSYAQSKHLAYTGGVYFEPFPGITVPELTLTYIQSWANWDLAHELSTFLVIQRGEEVSTLPQAIRVSETASTGVDAWQLAFGAFLQPAIGDLFPVYDGQGALRAASVRGERPADMASSSLSLTAGALFAAEWRASRHWYLGTGLSASNRFGGGDGPISLLDASLLSVSLHYRGWIDTLALTSAAEHPGGPYNAALQLSLRRNF